MEALLLSHQVSFHTLRLHPLPQVGDGIKCLVLDKNQLRHDGLKPRLEQSQTCVSAALWGWLNWSRPSPTLTL